MEIRHWGILISILGTVLLAFSLKSENQYSKHQNRIEIEKWAKSNDGFLPTYTRIDNRLFYIGLALIAIGSLLQW
jgi:hypothetical protein